MKKLKSTLALAAFAAVSMLTLNSCSDAEKVPHFSSGKIPTTVKANLNLKGVKGAHLFVLDDYNFEQMVEDRTGQALYPAGCSQARKGNFVSRNLDWYQLDESVYMVSVPTTGKHLGSLTVGALNSNYTHDSDMSQLTNQEANLLMAYATDGMNTAGVYIGVNVCPYDEMKESSATGAIDYQAPAGSVNADKPQLTLNFLCRLVLDNAKSMQDVKDIIQGTNWKDVESMTGAGFQLHWLIATKDASCVCEFIDGKPVFIDAENLSSPGYGTIMTNFSNYLNAKGVIQSHGAGYERFETLKSAYDKAEGLEGAKDLCRAVYYSRAYSESMDSQDFFWTEWCSNDIPSTKLREWKENPEARTGDQWELFRQQYDSAVKKYDWRVLGYDHYGNDFRGSWYTTHSSVWNLAEKNLTLDIEEQNKFAITVTLDGQVK